MSRTLCTTPATSPSRKISLASVISQASLPGCAPSPTTYCAAISPQHSVRIDMLPLSPEPMRSSTGNSVESVEQPCVAGSDAAPVLEAAEHVLDMMTLAIERLVIRDVDLS